MSARAPRTAARFSVNVTGLLMGLVTIWLTRNASYDGAIRGGLAALATFITIGGFELLFADVKRNASAGIADTGMRALSFARVGIRLFALGAVLAAIGAIYWCFSEYHGAFYDPFWTGLRAFGPWMLALAPFYFLWMDTHQREVDDAYLQLGRLILFHERPAAWSSLREMIAGWVVKAYFLPLMAVYMSGQVIGLTHLYEGLNTQSMTLFTFFYNLSFTVDLLFAIVGYSCTLRLFDSHVRTVEPTAFGWVIALMCYQPFFSIFDSGYLHYQGSLFWDTAFAGSPIFQAAWGIVILFLCITYALSTCAFGLRFSNLTNRGIITSGPYRWTKHPAYITKCLSFWMISVPFIEPLGWQHALRNCCALALINVIYYLRAKTEERHLMAKAPEYRAYAEWIAEHGLIARVRRIFA
jgi:protein-S-isoprenylcysteine O-methyltransferase Ste14